MTNFSQRPSLTRKTIFEFFYECIFALFPSWIISVKGGLYICHNILYICITYCLYVLLLILEGNVDEDAIYVIQDLESRLIIIYANHKRILSRDVKERKIKLYSCTVHFNR